jgi:hypothetical protein
MINKELLEQKIAEMKATIATYNGAIQFAEYLLSTIEEQESVTLSQFAEAVGGKGATAQITENK